MLVLGALEIIGNRIRFGIMDVSHRDLSTIYMREEGVALTSVDPTDAFVATHAAYVETAGVSALHQFLRIRRCEAER